MDANDNRRISKSVLGEQTTMTADDTNTAAAFTQCKIFLCQPLPDHCITLSLECKSYYYRQWLTPSSLLHRQSRPAFLADE